MKSYKGIPRVGTYGDGRMDPLPVFSYLTDQGVLCDSIVNAGRDTLTIWKWRGDRWIYYSDDYRLAGQQWI